MLRVRRRYTDRLTWEARNDFVGGIQARLNLGGRAYALTPASETVRRSSPSMPNACWCDSMQISASAGRRSVVWSGILAGGGVASGAGIVGLASLIPEGSVFLGAAVGTVWTLLGGAAAAGLDTAQRKRIGRGQLALEQILDRLDTAK